MLVTIHSPPPRQRSRFTEAAGAPAVMPMNTPSHGSGQSSAEACADCARRYDCEECFAELIRRFQSPLLHFLIRRVGSRQDAEDLLQETFLTAYRNLDRYRSTWRFSTWLFTIANRLAVSSRRRKLVDITAQPIREFSGGDPKANAEENEMRSKLWDAAQKILEPDSFAALWLKYVESMSADQIGRVLGRNANAVRILLHRARNRLAQHL
jgi:RNA polymerase sigma-70 factor, ECF subfamily